MPKLCTQGCAKVFDESAEVKTILQDSKTPSLVTPPASSIRLATLSSERSQAPAARRASQLITTHVDPVIKGVIRYKLHFNSHHAVEQAEADDISQEVMVQLLG